MPGTEKNAAQQNNPDSKHDNQNDAENVSSALQQAEKDIKKDPDLTDKTDLADDLDEGELARLEGQK